MVKPAVTPPKIEPAKYVPIKVDDNSDNTIIYVELAALSVVCGYAFYSIWLAALLGMIVEGFAFAGSSKVVNDLFPEDKVDNGEEIKRHDLAVEEYTRARDKYNKDIEELAYKESQRNENQQSAEIEHSKSVQSINTYTKGLRPPVLDDYLKKFNVYGKNGSSENNRFIIPLAVGSTVIVGVYLYGEHRRHRNERHR